MLIYKITNIKNNKAYIGQTYNTFQIRYDTTNWWDSTRLSKLVKYAVKKYGSDNFKVEILFEQKELNKNLLNDLEIHFIRLYNTMAPYGYNLAFGGRNSPKTEETKRKISLAKKGSISPRKGVKLSLEQIEKTRVKLLGKKRSKEHLASIYKSIIGNKFNLGRKHTEEQKKQRSIRMKNTSLVSHFKKGSRPTNAKKLILINKETNIQISFYSISDAQKFLHTTKKLIHNLTKNKGSLSKIYKIEFYNINPSKLENES